MSLDPILNAPLIIQAHIACAVLALLSGPLALFRRKRDRVHKVFGYIGSVAMVSLALTGLGIESNIAVIAWFGPIHLFCILALWGIGEAIFHIRRGNIEGHRKSMQSVWFGALGVTGLLTFLPGRTLNRALFGDPSQWGFVLIGAGLLGLWALWRWHATPAAHGKTPER